MDNIKEKLVDLVDKILRYLPWGSYSATNTAKKIADLLIENGVTIQNWNSTGMRLPGYGEKVLVCDTREDFVGIAVLQKGKYIWWSKKENYWRWNDMDMAFEEFTHWMPLPEPPKGE